MAIKKARLNESAKVEKKKKQKQIFDEIEMAIKKAKQLKGKHPNPKRQWHPSYLGSMTSKEAAGIHKLRKFYDEEFELSKMNRDRAEKAKKGTKKKSKPTRKRPVLVEGSPVKRKKKKTFT